MTSPAVDFSFIYTASDNDSNYVYDLVCLFLKVVPPGLANLERLMNETDDYPAIVKQAHFLKSSANIIKVRGMYDDLVKVEAQAKLGEGKEIVMPNLINMVANLKEAHPFLIKEQKKNKPKKVK